MVTVNGRLASALVTHDKPFERSPVPLPAAINEDPGIGVDIDFAGTWGMVNCDGGPGIGLIVIQTDLTGAEFHA